MDNNITTIIVTLITVLFGTGAWKFYEFIVKKKSDDKKPAEKKPPEKK